MSGLTGIIAIAAGRDFGLAVKADGTVWAWGNNNSAHLGDGTTVHRYTPVQTVGLTGITAVAAGYDHSVARKSDGTAWAWGSNSSGQLGAGSGVQGYTPVQVSGLTGVTGVAAGDAHSLAVESDGTVWGWGSNNSGQIGAGLAVTRYTPVQMPGIATATAVAAGSAHSLARLADGTVRAWGDNSKGQLGDGTTNGSTTPVTVLGLQGVDKIAARGNGSLARPTQATEQYTYDADGLRVTRSTGGTTWLYLGGGAWEERLGANVAGPTGWLVRRLYLLQGRAVAQQADTPDAIGYPSGRIFLHGDHLGSVSVATDNDRRVLSRQDYTPWGEARAGGLAQTTLDFTGQRKDGTGLLYYGARYYDPQLGRFLSADSIVPTAKNSSLTVDYHEFSSVQDARLDKQVVPRDPQALNRYSYVLNNPVRFTDPGGHCPGCPGDKPDVPGDYNPFVDSPRNDYEYARHYNYKGIYFKANADLRPYDDQIVVHHAIPLDVLLRYPGLFTKEELNEPDNLRGIPKIYDSELHRGTVHKAWNAFFRDNPSASRELIEMYAFVLDQFYDLPNLAREYFLTLPSGDGRGPFKLPLALAVSRPVTHMSTASVLKEVMP